MWVDDSSLAIAMALECHETVLGDAYRLLPENDAQHINFVELDAVLKGVNLALQWQSKVLHMKTLGARFVGNVSSSCDGVVTVLADG